MRVALVLLLLGGCGSSPDAPDPVDASQPDPDGPAPPPHVTAQVIDFETRIPVDGSMADRLTVAVAEPTHEAVADLWRLATADLVEMQVTATEPELTYEADYPDGFDETACVQVVLEELGAYPTVRCYLAAPEQLVDGSLVAEGTALDSSTSAAIEQALGGKTPSSLVLGQVIGPDGLPAAGALVTASSGTVLYLSDDLSSTAGLTETSASGVFVSVDAPYQGAGAEPNLWGASRAELASTEVVIGGLIANRVTIVILRLAPVPNP